MGLTFTANKSLAGQRFFQVWKGPPGDPGQDGELLGGVRYDTAQSLTDGQKEQVLENIGIALFDTRTAAAAATINSNINFARTAGYAAVGDGGEAIYKRSVSEPSHAGKFQSADGAWWELAEKRIIPQMFAGDISDGVVDARPAIQNAIDFLYAKGGGKLYIPAGDYSLSASELNEDYEIGGYPVNTDDYTCLLVRPGVSLIGESGAKFKTQASRTAIWGLSPSGQVIHDIEIDCSWDGVSAGTLGFGFVTVFPGDLDRTNLVAPGTFDTTTESWSVSGDGTIASNSSKLRLTCDNPVTTSPFMYKSFTTVIGEEYRVRIAYDEGTAPVGSLHFSLATGATVGDRFEEVAMNWPLDGGTFEPAYSRIHTFTATATTTYIHVYSDSDVGDLAADWFAIDNVSITQFDLADQMSWCRDFEIARCYIHDCSSYGIGLEDGDLLNVKVVGNRVTDIAGDGIDVKQRGPTQRNQGVVIRDNVVERFGQKYGGSAGIDTHGHAMIVDNTVRDFGLTGEILDGIRLRTYGPPGLEGDQAEGSVIRGFNIKGNAVGTARALLMGSSDCHVSHGLIEGCIDGVVISGNTFGVNYRSNVSHVTARGCDQYGFNNGGTDTTFVQCSSEDCGTAGFRNTGVNTKFIACTDTGSPIAKSTTTTPAITEQVINSFGQWGSRHQTYSLGTIADDGVAVISLTGQGLLIIHSGTATSGTYAMFFVDTVTTPGIANWSVVGTWGTGTTALTGTTGSDGQMNVAAITGAIHVENRRGSAITMYAHFFGLIQ